jgi:hypothetical protein
MGDGRQLAYDPVDLRGLHLGHRLCVHGAQRQFVGIEVHVRVHSDGE